MGRRRFSDNPPPPDDLRCRRSDGRDWRCPQPSLPGLSLCVYHHRRSYKNPSISPSPGRSSKSPPASTPTTADEKKPWKLRIRNPKRPASPSGEGGATGTPKSERTEDHKSSQRRRTNPDPPTSPPPEETANGNTKMTPIVLALARTKEAKKEPEEMQSEGTEGRRRRTPKPSQTETPTPVPVDSERCKRSDGRGWQCKARASPGLGYCEHHYKRVKLLKDLRMKKNSVGGAQGRKQQRLSAAAVAAAVKRQAEKQHHLVAHSSPAKDQEETMQLPKGLMTISPLVGSATMVRGSAGDKKVGVDSIPLMVRPIRSKNCPPEPVGPVKVLPLGGKKVNKERKKTCHRCGENKAGQIVRCLTCRKRYFCTKCIKKWYYGMSKAEIKSSCPVCQGCCTCKTCTLAPKNTNANDAAQKEGTNGQAKDIKIKYATSPFSQLLPAINKFNVDQLDELEMEAKRQGKRVSSVHVQMLEKGREEQLNCNNCRDSIVDFSRNCSKCSYKLCVSCCQKLRKEEAADKLKASDLINCKSSSCKSTSPLFHECDLMCPSEELGGCGSCTLDLVYLFPIGWSEALTINQEKRQLNASNSTHTESRDAVSSHCPSRANGKVNQLSSKPQETLSGFL